MFNFCSNLYFCFQVDRGNDEGFRAGGIQKKKGGMQEIGIQKRKDARKVMYPARSSGPPIETTASVKG